MAAEPVTAAQRRLSRASVPEGWRVVHLGDVFEQIVDTGHSLDLPVLSVTMNGEVVRRSSLDRKSDREVPREKYLRVRPGDIAYNTMRMWQGASGLVQEDGYISPAYMVCRPKAGESSEFWAAYFRYEPMIRSFRDHSQGFAKDRYRLYFHHFATVPALRPPLGEQRKIAGAIASVAETIASTGALIRRLQIVSKDLIETLLTRGLPDQHIKLENSEIGEMPTTWRILSLEEGLEGIEAGWSPNCEQRPAGEEEWGVLKVSSVSLGRFLPEENKKLPKGTTPRLEAIVKTGDVILSRANTPDLVVPYE